MANGETQRRRRPPRPSPHHEPYPDRLHRHLAGAADALQRIEAPPEPAGEAPTPADLLEHYAGNDGLNTLESEGGSDGRA